jgi:hypothetical protein
MTKRQRRRLRGDAVLEQIPDVSRDAETSVISSANVICTDSSLPEQEAYANMPRPLPARPAVEGVDLEAGELQCRNAGPLRLPALPGDQSQALVAHVMMRA